MDTDDTTIGQRVRLLRRSRGKSLEVVAGLAGISPSYLSRLESGERSLDRRSLIVALANALQVSPMELTSMPVPAPGDGAADAAIDRVRGALQAVTMGVPGGAVQPVEQLSARMHAVLAGKQQLRHAEVGLALPALIRDLHTTLADGRGDTELLRLSPVFHQQAVAGYLHAVGAPGDLCWQAATLGRDAAERLAEPIPLGFAAWGTANSLLQWSGLDLATEALRGAPDPTGEDELDGMLALTRSLVAAATGHPADVDPLLDHAADLAERTGEGDYGYMTFGPTNVTLWRLSVALERGDHEHAAELADGVDPQQIRAPKRAASFWVNRGRALAQVRRRDEAVLSLRRAEKVSPDAISRNPVAQSLLGELIVRAKQDAVGRELRGMAYRAGLPV